MPLVRVEVRNEFGLGRRALYGEGADREDPKAVLDGVAVAGLTGILRQLGDLSEFAAEVFHGLQEQISMISSRSHKLIARTQRLEATLPSLEKLVLAQTSHIHFAYTAGSEWHARIQGAQHHFIDNDLPRFIMDSYEECRDPPRLHLLDKFDPIGAGSCLRRYSDPTFFRRVSAVIDETNSLKLRGEKRARKMKKKRSLSKNAVFARGASRFNQSSRLQFSSPIMSGLSSPAASASDSTFKSDAGHGVNSSGMRMQSGCIECTINHRIEMQPEEQEYSRSSSSSLMLHDDTVNSVSTHEGSPAVGGCFLQKEHEEGSTFIQSSITWDEKAEIVVDAEEYKHELNEAATEAEVLTSSGLSSGKAISEKIDEAEISHHDNDNTKSAFLVNSVDDADSGPDNYEDALNAIDPESEGDVKCQTKQEVMQFFTDVDVKEIGVTNDEITTNNSDCSPFNIENDSSYCNPPVEVTCLQSSESASDIGDGGVICQIQEGFANSDSPPRDVMSQSVDTGNIETLESAGAESTALHNLSEHVVEHQESPKIPRVQFWTNGGLLGLQPSKPPDFAASNTPSSCSGARSIDDGINNNHLDEKPARPAKIAECIERELCEPSIADGSTSQNDEIRMATLAGNAGAKSETVCRNWSYSNGDEPTSTTVMVPGNLIVVAPTSDSAQNESRRETEENFSSILGLGQKLLANSLGFRKKISANSDEGSNPAFHSKSIVHNRGSWFPEGSSQTDSPSAFKEQFQNVVAANQRPPSPPLEHMKISFRPMNGFSASSLRLKFPYSIDRQDSSRDMFASFQLVPESTIPFQDVCFNSDDGTFCRSSPYMSDDSASHLSASDSDEWELNHSSKEKEHDHHDSGQRLSSARSFSTSQEQQGIVLDRRFGSMRSENGEDPIASFSLHELSLDLPSFELMNSPTVQEHNLHAHPNIHKMRDPLQSTPQPPPFPPPDSKNLQLHPNGSEMMQVLENDLLDRHAVSETSELDMFQNNCQDITGGTLKSKDHPKLSPHKESKLNANGLEANERGDFLQQIRAKSFSLRPTVPRPTSTAAATANFKVNAILQKANSIRQAVGSEDGDGDDSWSDNV